MSNWTTETIQRGPCTTVIRRPVLTNEERAKRMGAIKQAAAKLLTATEVGKRKEVKA